MAGAHEDYPSTADFDGRRVGRAWDAFVAGQPFPRADLRALVVASWQRCRDRGSDPLGACGPPVTAASLAERRSRHGALVRAADQTWRVMSDSLIASDSLFILADPEGVLLDVRGNGELVTAAARERVAPGCDWSESASGTNAVGTALVLERPTIVRTSEHYCRAAKIWDCAASPIRDLTDGTLLGVLDVTSVGELSDSHTLALAVTAAKQIEHTLHARELARSVQLLNWYRACAERWRGAATLLLDGKGRVITVSDAAAALGDTRALHAGISDAGPTLPPGCPYAISACVRYAWPDGGAGAGPWEGGVIVVEPRASRDTAVIPSTFAAPVAASRHPAFAAITTADDNLLGLMERAERMALSHSPILVSGETGSGKELFARAIHACSPVAGGPFVAVNCGTLTPELAVSELLGYEAGAFTGASHKGRRGKFEEADGGTLFLDEIGELSNDVQVHLLRVLQDGVVVRLGGNQERPVKARVIAATNRDLGAEARAGRFRVDLYYRLRVLSLELPPLRERPRDIALLVDGFLRRLQGTYGLGPRSASPDLVSALEAHDWPGNVRELHGLVESLYILADRALLTPADLPRDFPRAGRRGEPRGPEVGATTKLRHLEQDTIARAVAEHGDNLSEVARRLGISRSTLYRKLRQHGLGPR